MMEFLQIGLSGASVGMLFGTLYLLRSVYTLVKRS